MKGLRNLVAVFALCSLLLAPALALAEELIKEIQIVGSARVLDSTILLQVSSEVGQAFNRETVEKDLKEIYRTGFFRNVSAERAEEPDGLVLRFAVREKPSIRNVYIEGNEEIDDETLTEQLNLAARKFFDSQKLAPGIDAAKAYYQSQGYYGTDIVYEAVDVEENQVDLTFTVTEGNEKVIREIVFEGAREIDGDDLEDELLTSTYAWWASWITGSGVVDDEKLKNDVQIVNHYYLTRGFADIKVSDPRIEETDEGLRVVFEVSEGEIFSVGALDAKGDLIDESVDSTLAELKLVPGDVFNADYLREDTFSVTEKFTDIGYAFTNVEPDTTLDRNQNLVNVTFRVDKGNIVTIDHINVTGNQKTRDNVVRRSLQIQERERFSSSQIRRSEEILKRLGHFDEVTITQEPTQNENEVDLTVDVREGNTGAFSAGAGVSSGDGFIFSLRVSENNIFGSGNSLTFDVNSGSRRENFVLSFQNPRVDDTRWSAGFDLLKVEREFDDFDRNQAGASVTVGYPLWFLGKEYLEDVRFSLRYEFLNIEIDNVQPDAPQLVMDEEGTSTSSSITPRITRNTIDNPLDPTSGSRQQVSVEIAGIGGQEEFWLGNLSNTFYYPIYEASFGTFVVAQRTRFGWGETYNNDDFPLFRRFFPGGINSVRGFDTRELGPRDGDGNEFGGNKQLIGNFEFIFPVFPEMGLKGLFFYDIGDAFDDEEDIEFSELRQAIGWGIRWRSPIAPIRIEIGYPLDREEGDKAVVTNFSFGAPL